MMKEKPLIGQRKNHWRPKKPSLKKATIILPLRPTRTKAELVRADSTLNLGEVGSKTTQARGTETKRKPSSSQSTRRAMGLMQI